MTTKRILVFVLLSLLFAGCGNDNDFSSPSGSTSTGPQGGGGGGPSPNGFPITARVTAPRPGFPLSSLQVVNSTSAGAVSPAGEFTLSDFAASGGQLMFVLDESGKLVYAAFQENGQEVGARTTAHVLLFFATGGYALPANLQTAYRAQLFNLPELDDLAAAIAAALAEQPSGLVTSPTIAAALQAAIASMKERAALPQTSNRLLIDPSNGQSGIAPSERGADQLVITNSYRRPAWAYVTKVATTEGDGPEVPVNPPVAIADFEIPPIKGAATFADATVDAAIVAFEFFEISGLPRGGPVAGEPVTTSPVVLPGEDGVSVKYSLEVIGPGLSAPSPTDPRQQQKLEELTLTYGAEMMLQFLFNVFLNAPAVGDRLEVIAGNRSDVGNLMSDFIKVVLLISPNIADKAAAGDLQGVLGGMYDVITSPTSEGLILEFMLTKAAPAVGLSVANADQVKFMAAYRSVFTVVNSVDLVLSSADTAFAGGSIASASRYVQFDVKTLAARVRLTPLDPSLQVNEEQQFTATVPSVTLEEGQFLEFQWSCSGTAGTLRAPTGSQVNNFTTSQTAGPIYTAEDEGTDTIEVTVTLVDAGENIETVLGTASTSVTVAPEPENGNLVESVVAGPAGLSFLIAHADFPKHPQARGTVGVTLVVDDVDKFRYVVGFGPATTALPLYSPTSTALAPSSNIVTSLDGGTYEFPDPLYFGFPLVYDNGDRISIHLDRAGFGGNTGWTFADAQTSVRNFTRNLKLRVTVSLFAPADTSYSFEVP